MNAKKANYLFLSTILFEAAFVAAFVFLAKRADVRPGVLTELVLNQLVILAPTLLFLAGSKENPLGLIPSHKIRIPTVFLTILFTYLCMPLIVLVNAVSMLFVENAVNDMAGLVATLPPILVVGVIGVIGPACEEFVFRGVIYHSYRRSGKYIAAMLLSAFLFGITHLNFNQMSYAILVGVIGVLLIEASGSIFSSMIFHMVVNTTNIVPVLLNPDQYANGNASVTTQVEQLGMSYHDVLMMAIGVYAVIAVITTAIALWVLHGISSLEGREEHMRAFFVEKPEEASKLISWPLLVAVILCFVYMFLTV